MVTWVLLLIPQEVNHCGFNLEHSNLLIIQYERVFTIELNKQGRANRMARPFLSSYYTCVYFLNFLLNNPSPINPEPMLFEGKY
jgi:hypothetical protein